MKKIGVDIGGTTIKGARFDENGGIEAEFSAPTHGNEGREQILEALFSVIDTLNCGSVCGIGISSAGNIDPSSGICVYATDNLLGWTGTEIRSVIENRYGLLCRVDNDAVCALKGELSFYPDLRNVTMLTFGTGVGGASFINGDFVRGKHFDAARWGHVCLSPKGRACNCGRRGCAESYLSATALLRYGKEAIPSLSSCKELFERYAAGERAAIKQLKTFGRYLNLLLTQIRTAIAPELILLGGGVVQSEEIVKSLIEDTSDIAFARLGNRAGVYGAVSILP
jgi:glucokinase